MTEATPVALLKAQMTLTPGSGRWRLRVALEGPVSGWPEIRFTETYGIPTLADRTAALVQLGYALASPDSWTWTEGQNQEHEPVDLVASATVRSTTAEG